MKLARKEFLTLSVLMALAFIFRLFLIRNNHFLFLFDQSRDAYLSRQILEKADVKIQGPSASGTGDAVFHGVLYYYLIGPIYSLFGGNPLAPTIFLALLNSLTIIPIYLLGKSLFQSTKIGFWAAWLWAFSADAAVIATWLSNPTLASLTISCFFLFAYQVFFKHKTNYLVWLVLWLGLSQQAAIYTSYLIFYLAGLWLFKQIKPKPKQIFVSLLVYALTISTMVLTEFKLWRQGLFSLNNFSSQASGTSEASYSLKIIFDFYALKLNQTFLPQTKLLLLSVILFMVLISFMFNQKKRYQEKLFLLSWFLAPLILLTLSGRSSYHSLVGILPAILLVLAFFMVNICQKKSKWLLWILVAGFTLVNLIRVQQIRQEKAHLFGIPKGTFLIDQLALIDYTYQQAQGQEFSISSLTNPYGYNTTWAYLFDWYGQNKYGYKPFFWGNSQDLIPAGELLTPTLQPLLYHFSLYEPEAGIPQEMFEKFREAQKVNIGPIIDQKSFGSLLVETRIFNRP